MVGCRILEMAERFGWNDETNEIEKKYPIG
jgi:hypothetical protein